MLRGLDLTTLRVFRAAVEERSLARAAERENIALSAASRRVAALEERFGAPLLRRHDRGVEATAAGQALMAHLGSLFDLLGRMGADMDAFAAGARGHVRLWANMSAVSGFLPEALAGFLPAHPGIRLTLEERYTTDILHAVGTGVADLGLVSATVRAPGLRLLPWRHDRLQVLLPAGHPLAALPEIGFAAVAVEPFVGLAAETALQRLYRREAAKLGLELQERVNVGGFDGVRRMVEAGLGLAILPAAGAAPRANGGTLLTRPLAEAWALRPLALCVREDAATGAAVRLLTAHLLRPPG